MKMRKSVFILLLGALLACGMALTGCPSDDSGETVKPGVDKPLEIARHPASKSCTEAEWQALSVADKTLTVVPPASQSNVSYQWYSRTSATSDGTIIQGATGASYLPPITGLGNYWYYVIVKVGSTELVSGTALIRITPEAPEAAPTQFKIGTTRLNYVRGVGGTGSFMFRDGSNADASPDADVRYIDLLMGEMGCNILRIMVQDDYLNYIKNTVQSRNESVFYHDARANFFAVIRRVNEYGGYVFANPWTAPGEYKVNGQVRGGSIITTPQNYVGYADWLRGFLKWLNDNNAPIFSLGILNEPDNGMSANYEGMGMDQDVHRDWFRTVGHFTTQRVTNQSGASVTNSIYADDIIPGYGGGGKTHHVLAMTADNMGRPAYYDDIINSNAGINPANNNFEILGHHLYNSQLRVTKLAGDNASTAWADRPLNNYVGRFETESLAQSPQMFAPGSKPGSIKREVWQTEHDYNYWSVSTNIPGSNVQRYWNSAFAAMNDVDWSLRVNHESVYDWWFSSSYSGLVTSYQGAPRDGNGQYNPQSAGATPWPMYTYTPRGRAFAHYARYVNETWLLDISRTKGDIEFNKTTASLGFNAGATDPKISAFEDTNGKFITIVMFTPNASTNTNAGASTSGLIGGGFGAGGRNGIDDPTRLSTPVGRIEVVLPDGFTATSASALRSYGWVDATGEPWDDVPEGTPRYWINEPVFLSANGKSVEVTLPGGNIISIMVKGSWASGSGRHFEPRVRPYTVN
jgi:O-glycosyl hydrolase